MRTPTIRSSNWEADEDTHNQVEQLGRSTANRDTSK